MGEAVEQRRRHFGITEDRGPFAEAEVGGDHHAGGLEEFAQQMEQQRAAGFAERQVSQLVKDHEVELGQVFCDLPGLALGLFLFEGVNQFDGGEEGECPTFCVFVIWSMLPERSKDNDDFERTAGRIAEGLQAA